MPAAASASAPATRSLDAATVAEAHAFFDRYGVSTATADRLLGEYEHGGTWLALTGSARPVSTRSQDDGDALATVSTYADGSIAVQRDEKAVDVSDPRLRGVSGCSKSGTAYSNCKAEMWFGLVAMSFRVSYNLQSGNNRVTSVYGATWSIGGSCSTKQQYFGRPNSKVARLDVLAQMCVIPHSEIMWLQFSVGGNKTSLTMG
ncbi:hypothetical protein [Frondihabitans australicus]|uniref:Uncharacterized protein n=1 Tax=Frondihabitans australicus TaxID=386892 RepID=A0A495IFH9_9MICO|nr:hypothetical protein [Frondihabitans australicus]RKR74410.1 hypothetical protein C8E83_1522 [Frondihabitans australicus]